MSKRTDELIEVDLFADHTIDTASKRHKRKKHKQKPKVLSADDDSDALDVVNDGSETTMLDSPVLELLPPLITAVDDKLKNINCTSGKPPLVSPNAASLSSMSKQSQKRKKGRNRDSGTSSEEERWLDAIESGKLEQVDEEMKKLKDPKLMTARQRAMYERGTDKEPCPSSEILMALPSGYKEKVMTAEAIQKAAIKSQKRKQLADEKREKDKKKTMERLLKKQESRIAKNSKNRPTKSLEPVISYRSTATGTTITFPPSVELPFQKMFNDSYSPGTDQSSSKDCSTSSKDCAMCGAAKKYNCSRTNIPLCSFMCYTQNVASLKQIIC